MKTLNDQIKIYKNTLDQGDIQTAYRAIIRFILDLKIYLKNEYPTHAIGQLYQGYMDISFITFTPPTLKAKKLKITLVFIHGEAAFEVWLCGNNKKEHYKYFNLFKQSDWNQYPLNMADNDAIIKYKLIESPDFNNLNGLMEEIEKEANIFEKAILNFFLE